MWAAVNYKSDRKVAKFWYFNIFCRLFLECTTILTPGKPSLNTFGKVEFLACNRYLLVGTLECHHSSVINKHQISYQPSRKSLQVAKTLVLKTLQVASFPSHGFHHKLLKSLKFLTASWEIVPRFILNSHSLLSLLVGRQWKRKLHSVLSH